ncbi:peptide chain release factor N(5)-glutamine methyltransferase [Rhizobium sp. BK251]|uniref:peptide chain release factor N(5)-glutamine methyltransferase n=1 Tax=Rhizobium sp. BK251 TaxID=2512125 RepID=UPI001052D2E6|nr:peptide chain release factor N(5)-glutamine methyltransferase [Rhizobium sp. BK251]TCL72582.1 release factor glutamine methyltransferase [Rhizobium sp. BK251]
MSLPGPTIGELLNRARTRFAAAGLENAAADAHILIGGLLGLSRVELLSREKEQVEATSAQRIEDAIRRRLDREPVYRILGRREFYGLALELSPDTLEPRPDTEILVDTMLPHVRRLAATHGEVRILDLGTGTGAICLALLKECPEAIGTGVDIAAGAVLAAQKNARENGLDGRFEAIEGSWFGKISGEFHAIVSNPPYIPSSVISTLAPEVKEHDPAAALDGGNDGLDAYRAIAKDAARFLCQDGIVGLEIGYDQRMEVTAIFTAENFRLLESVRDYGKNDRVVVFAYKS